MKARVAHAARQQSANQLELKKNLDNLQTTIDRALAIDEQLKIEIEKAAILRERVVAEREERNQAPATPPHGFVP
jgi:hypothetical protein